MHALIGLLASQPQRLVEHVQGYGELAAVELRSASARWRVQAVLLAVGALALAVALALAGVAVMLSALLPQASEQGAWMLVLVPAAPALLALGALLAYSLRRDAPVFDDLRRQWRADVAMLREAEEP